MKQVLSFLLAVISFTGKAQLQRFTTHEIIINMPSKVIGGATLQRKAHCNTISIEPTAAKVTLYIDVYYYLNDSTMINDPAIGIVKYSRQAIADTSTLINAATGLPVVPLSQQYITDSTGTHLNPLLVGLVYMMEYEAFRAQMESPVIVADLTRNKMQWLAATGKLD